VRFLIVDDHPLFRQALENCIHQAIPDAESVEAATIDEALDALSCSGIDLTLLDLSLPGTTGLSGLIRLRKAFPATPIVVMSCHEHPLIVASGLFLGASGYIPKSASKDELVHSIGEVLRGSIYLPNCCRNTAKPDRLKHHPLRGLLKRLHDLTPQQLRILELIHRGLQNKQIAYELKICETTVKVHVSEILRRLNVTSRTKAIVEMSKIDFTSLAGSDLGLRIQASV
jgi:DNA-binding NarL/FixJ family response regulator